MDRPALGLRLKAITPPRQEIMRIWRTLRPVDRAFVQGIIGDVDPQHAVFNFQGTELAPTIEEYTALIQRPTPTTQGIFVPNPFAVIRSQLSTLLGIPAQEVHQELHQGWDHGVKIAWLSDWTLLRALTPSTASYQRDACHGFSEWRHFWRELTPARFLWVARWSPGGPMITRCPGIVGVPLLSHLGNTLIFPGRGSMSPQRSQTAPIPRATPTSAPEAESSTQAAMHAELQFIREERDRLRCELVDSSAEVADYRELQTELARARARIATLDREMGRLSPTLDRVQARARGISHP
ncbi:hypothetical protein CRG98_012629 [Punica granatum]|uniref:Aminotransferase-like plant mobile domain-containing protein n=1 Tax=Punica granatum TaxID=22663 RepID=A0A2I0KEN4_PUNGR|nr:hypothetical protein CRG98_012629 [Punica granatum]